MERGEIGHAPRDHRARPERDVAVVLHHVGVGQELLQHQVDLPLVVGVGPEDLGQHVRDGRHRLLHPENVDLLHVRVVELGAAEQPRAVGDVDAPLHQHAGQPVDQLAVVRLGLDEDLHLARRAPRPVVDLVVEEPEQLVGHAAVLHPRRRRDPDLAEITRRGDGQFRIAQVLAHAVLEEPGAELEEAVARDAIEVVHAVPIHEWPMTVEPR
jgi:hypothetical protein